MATHGFLCHELNHCSRFLEQCLFDCEIRNLTRESRTMNGSFKPSKCV